MKRLRLIAILLAALMVVAVVAACAPGNTTSSNPSGSQKPATSGSQNPATSPSTPAEIKEFTAFFAMPLPDHEVAPGNTSQEKIAELTGGRVKETWLVGQTDKEAIGTIIAGGDYPDFINGGDAMLQLYEAGTLVALDEYLDSGKYPLLKSYFTPAQWERFRQSDGHIYWINTFSTIFEKDMTPKHDGEALDGAGYLTIFFRIISPLCVPVYATILLFVAVGQWNSWFDAMLFNRLHEEYTTLQYELMKLLSSVTNSSGSIPPSGQGGPTVTPTSVRAAASILTMLPIVCLYPFLQRYFITGLTIGGVKE